MEHCEAEQADHRKSDDMLFYLCGLFSHSDCGSVEIQLLQVNETVTALQMNYWRPVVWSIFWILLTSSLGM